MVELGTVRAPTRRRRPANTAAVPISTQSKRKLRPSPPSTLTVCIPTRGRNRTNATKAASPASLSAFGQSTRTGAATVATSTRPATASDLLDLGPAEQAGRQEHQHQDQ